MAEWIDVARVADFAPGTVRTAMSASTRIAVINANGRFYAIEDVCTHEAEALSGGELIGDTIMCPRHFAEFSVVTGEALSPPAYEPVATFPVRVENGVVQVGSEPGEPSRQTAADSAPNAAR